MATEYKGVSPVDGTVRQRQKERVTKGEEGCGVTSSICPDNISCAKLMKLVSSLLLHRSAHYGSYDLIASSSLGNDRANGRTHFSRARSKLKRTGVEGACGGLDRSKSNILTFSTSDEDLKSPVKRRQKPGRRQAQNENNTKSLDAENLARGVRSNGIFLKSVVFTSVDNLPLTVALGGSEIDIDGTAGKIFAVPDKGFSKV
jgi:hypothetical protein